MSEDSESKKNESDATPQSNFKELSKVKDVLTAQKKALEDLKQKQENFEKLLNRRLASAYKEKSLFSLGFAIVGIFVCTLINAVLHSWNSMLEDGNIVLLCALMIVASVVVLLIFAVILRHFQRLWD